MSSLTFELSRALQYIAMGLATERALKLQLQEMGLVEQKSPRFWILTVRGKDQLDQLTKLPHKRRPKASSPTD